MGGMVEQKKGGCIIKRRSRLLAPGMMVAEE